MSKYLFFIFILLCILNLFVYADDVPVAGRTWTYGSFTLQLSKSFGWMLLPGFRYEFSRELEGESIDTKDLYFYEFFIGPMFFTNISKTKVIIPILYYYMGFPIKSLDKYTYSYSLEVSPTFIYKFYYL